MPFAYRAIAEEVEDASLVVPRCMWWSYVLNVILGILMLIVMLFGIGNLDDALNSTAPYLNLFRNTGSTGMALALSIILFLLILSGNITALATASRELWAFSRDRISVLSVDFSRKIFNSSLNSFHSLYPRWLGGI